MTIEQELTSFRRFAEWRIGSEGPPASLDEVYEDWRSIRSSSGDVEAIREALADMDAGEEGQPYEEFIEEMRQKYGLASAPVGDK